MSVYDALIAALSLLTDELDEHGTIHLANLPKTRKEFQAELKSCKQQRKALGSKKSGLRIEWERQGRWRF